MPKLIRDEILGTHDVSFVVIAGAGTGKTTLLINKIVRLIEERKAAMAEIAAITFTEKAAAEIALRLKDLLDERLAMGVPPDSPLIEAREQLEAAAITTLHGFAGRLLRERPVEAKLPPDHRVQDPVQADLLFTEVFNRWEEVQLSEERPEWRLLLENGHASELRALALELSRNLDTVLDHPLEPPCPPGELGVRFVASIQEPLEKLRKALSAVRDPEDAAARQGIDQLRALEDIPAELLAAPPRLLKYLKNLPVRLSGGAKGKWYSPAALEEVKQVTVELREAIAALETGWKDVLAYDAWFVLQSFLEELRREKHNLGVVDFNDLLRMTRDLLRDRPDVRAYFQEKFKVLLVDEFQDTDPLQAEILFYLAEDGHRARDWREAKLTAGKLFIVGDPKQSIYRFRRADVEVFEQVRELIAVQGGRVRTLERNFRSLTGIVHFVNAWFGQHILPPEDGGRYQPQYDPLEPQRESPPDEPRVELLIDEREAPLTGGALAPGLGPQGGSRRGAAGGAGADGGATGGAGTDGAKAPAKSAARGYNADEARAVEAMYIAERLKQMLGREALIRDGGSTRVVYPRDVAILFRATTHLDLYTDALRDRDIPYRVIGSKRFYAAPEIIDLTNVLRAVAAPHDRMALVGALRSPAFGLSDPEITVLARANALDYRREVKLEGALQHVALDGEGHLIDLQELQARVAGHYETLLELHRRRDRVPLSTLVGQALDRTSLWPVSYASFGGEQKALNLEKVRSLARTYESAGMRSLMEFTDTLLDAIRGRQQEEESSAAEESDDVVRILTVHKSKGLEFPVVFLPGLMASAERVSAIFLEDRDRGHFGFQLNTEVMTARFPALKEREKPRLDAESLRLFYVAATRAKDYLVMTGVHHDREKESVLDKLEEFFEGQLGPRWRAAPLLTIDGCSEVPEVRAREKAVVRMIDVKRLQQDAQIARSRQSLIQVVNLAEPALVAPQLSAIEASREALRRHREMLRVSKPSITWVLPSMLEKKPEEPKPKTQAELRARREAELRARQLGVLVHRALEPLNYHAPADARELVDRATRLLAWEQQPAMASMREEAVTMVADLLRSPLLRRLRQGLELGREMPVLYRPRTGVAVDGKIDLLFQEPDGSIVVLDYKTDDVQRGREEELAEVHLPQLEVYTLAVLDVSGIKPASVLIHFLKTDVSVERPVNQAFLERARERLAAWNFVRPEAGHPAEPTRTGRAPGAGRERALRSDRPPGRRGRHA